MAKPKRGRRKRRRNRKKTQPEHPPFQIGDSVVVKSGVSDPDFDIPIGGWQGRVSEIAPAGNQDAVMIDWDSITLRNMPDWVIEQSAEQGLSWTSMGLATHKIDPASPRDAVEDVAQAAEELAEAYAWSWLGEEGRRINEILAGVDPDDLWACMKAWGEHFREHLTLPFEAEVDEFQERGPLQAGDRVTVKRVIITDDLYGVIVRVMRGRRRYDFPLCDLEALDEKSPNYQMIRDYRVWFANR